MVLSVHLLDFVPIFIEIDRILLISLKITLNEDSKLFKNVFMHKTLYAVFCSPREQEQKAKIPNAAETDPITGMSQTQTVTE